MSENESKAIGQNMVECDIYCKLYFTKHLLKWPVTKKLCSEQSFDIRPCCYSTPYSAEFHGKKYLEVGSWIDSKKNKKCFKLYV